MSANRIELRLTRAAFEMDLAFDLPARGITVVFGPSGCGKTSLLRAVAGLEPGARGRVRMGTEWWQDDQAGIRWPAWRRGVGYVFQEASLFEHLDVSGNLRFAARRNPGPAPEAIVAQAVDWLDLAPLMTRRVAHLSGGERQRVAIARALASGPRVLLLDEPLSALDLQRRRDILPLLERLRRELHLPMLYVTHSADEALRLADHLVVLREGRVEAAGPAQDWFAASTPARLDGDDLAVWLDACVGELAPQWHLMRADADGVALWLPSSGQALGDRVRLRVSARDVSLSLSRPEASSIQNLTPVVIQDIVADSHPSALRVSLRSGDARLVARVTARAAHQLALRPGLEVWAQVKSVALSE